MRLPCVEPFDIVAPRLVPAGLNRIQRIENCASHFLVVVKPFDQRSEFDLEPLALIPTNRLSPSKHIVVDVLVWIGDYEEEKLSKSASIYIVHATILATNAEPVEPIEKTLRTNRLSVFSLSDSSVMTRPPGRLGHFSQVDATWLAIGEPRGKASLGEI